MKINWKTIKVLFAAVIIVGITFSTVNLVRPYSYSEADLSFSVGSGSVSVINPSAQSVSAQMIGTGTRSFSVISTDEAISGSSTTQGSGSNRTQLFEFELPSGTSEFTISRGTDVNFIANTATELQATVNLVSNDVLGTTIIATGVVVLAALFYISKVTEHRWISTLRRMMTSAQPVSIQDAKPIVAVANSGQGQPIRSYGDNRAKL